jgi:hypothetical protein
VLGVETKIAVAMRGNCPFSVKATQVAAAGYIALVIVNTDDNLIPPGLGAVQVDIPVVMVGKGEGQKVLQQARLSIVISEEDSAAMKEATRLALAAIAKQEASDSMAMKQARAEELKTMGSCNFSSITTSSGKEYRRLSNISLFYMEQTQTAQSKMLLLLLPDASWQKGQYQPYHTDQGADCNRDNTLDLIATYQKNRIQLCTNGAEIQKVGADKTTIVAFTRQLAGEAKQEQQQNMGDHVIVALNVMVNFSRFSVAPSKHGFVEIDSGFLVAEPCSLLPSSGGAVAWPASEVASDTRSTPFLQGDDIFGPGLVFERGVLQSCARWHEEPVVMHVSRRPWNAYHSLESLFTVFTALMVAGIRAEDATMVLLDKRACGPWLELYSRWFRLTLTLTDMQQVAPAGICLRRVITTPSIEFNEIGRHTQHPLRCPASPLFRWFSDTLLHAQKLPLRGHILDHASATLVMRKEQSLATSWQRGRIIPKSFWDDTQRLISSRCLGEKLTVSVVAFEDHTFAQQLRIARSTRVYTAVHGAALAHMVYMAPGSHIIEIAPGSNVHYKNWASLLGHVYETLSSPDDAQVLADLVVLASEGLGLCTAAQLLGP